MALETCSRPELKHSIWKNAPDFSCFFLFCKENSHFLKVFIRCNLCIRAASKHFGKTHFQLSFIIAVFSTFCQISNHFPKIKPFLFRKALNTGSEAICPCYFKITGLHILTKKIRRSCMLYRNGAKVFVLPSLCSSPLSFLTSTTAVSKAYVYVPYQFLLSCPNQTTRD